ncbi:MAG TPA: hypothetical protein VNA25_01285 [Phycisphaerae bacterium]|nr:hypothetical protein [Phycisphaerae bacterium]
MVISEDSSTPSLPHAASPPPRGGPGAAEAVNPAALSVEQLARMLAITEEKVRKHLAAGAPTGPDGTVNLVHYAAWLIRRLKELNGDGEATS